MKLKIGVIISLLAFSACHKHNAPKPILPPSKALLLFPALNSACTEANFFSALQSEVTFSWQTAENTENYWLYIKNLGTGVNLPVQITKNNSMVITLDRALPYSWYIESHSSKTNSVGTSNVWKFYNPGIGKVTYAPFPADLTSPSFSGFVTPSSGTINLVWAGSDPDSDDLKYDAYFSTESSPGLKKVILLINF